jgi:membrane protease subunit (stomatin/prohibitin family)
MRNTRGKGNVFEEISMDPIEFTNNYEDLSTDKGFQFKFYCQRCGNGYLSSYKLNKLGLAGGLFGAASSLLGGMFGGAVEGAYEVQRSVGGQSHDAALREAVQEIRPLFVQCRRCGKWICRSVCYNGPATMCKECSPLAEETETSLRAQHAQTEVADDLEMEEERRKQVKAKQVEGKCMHCGKPTLGKKFCPHCGKPTGLAKGFCPNCGAKAAPGAKFCGECGGRLGPV